MNKRNHLLACIAIALFLWCAFGASPAWGQRNTGTTERKQPNQEQILQALLTEIRQLRLAFERTNMNLFRAQILVERIRLQQNRVDGLQQQLEEVRNQTSDSGLNQTQLAERTRDIESRINQERDPKARSDLENERKELKNLVDQQGAWEQRQREKENQLMAQIQTEQDKLKRLNDRLDAFERELEGQSRGADRNP